MILKDFVNKFINPGKEIHLFEMISTEIEPGDMYLEKTYKEIVIKNADIIRAGSFKYNYFDLGEKQVAELITVEEYNDCINIVIK